MDMRLLVAVLLAGMLAKMPAAQAERTPRRIDAAQWSLPSFRDAHPDLKHRLLAQQALDAGDYAIAIREFTRAADFGDKLSQAMLAELYLTGEGVAKDLARAYAWMDLAAGRGFAPFVGKRESIWGQLDGTQQSEALQIGAALYARHGDDVALPRLEKRIRRELKRMGGSRTGFANAGSVVLPSGGGTRVRLMRHGRLSALGGPQMDLAHYYAPEFWRPQQYLAWKDAQWNRRVADRWWWASSGPRRGPTPPVCRSLNSRARCPPHSAAARRPRSGAGSRSPAARSAPPGGRIRRPGAA